MKMASNQIYVCDAVFVQLPPMLMHLFPGCSVSDVLCSSEGRAVRAQLKDTIRACNSSSHQQRSATRKTISRQGDAGPLFPCKNTTARQGVTTTYWNMSCFNVILDCARNSKRWRWPMKLERANQRSILKRGRSWSYVWTTRSSRFLWRAFCRYWEALYNKKKKIMQYLLPFHVCFVCTCSIVVPLISCPPGLFVAKNDLKCLSMTVQLNNDPFFNTQDAQPPASQWKRTSPASRKIRSLTPRKDGKSPGKNVSDLKVIGLNWHCVSLVAIHGENLQCLNPHQYSLNVNLKNYNNKKKITRISPCAVVQ